MSGCPNGCSQHHIANIGFYGAAMKVGGRQLPAYIAHLGGNYEGGEVVMGKRLKARIPAKRVPDAVERWVRHYEQNRNDGEEFNDFVERVGADEFEGLVKDLSLPVEFSPEHITHFIDWNRKDLYEVVRGEGECARLGFEQGSREVVGVEGPQVLEALADPDQLHGQLKLFGNRKRDAALGGAVELRQHDAGHVDGLAEELGLT